MTEKKQLMSDRSAVILGIVLLPIAAVYYGFLYYLLYLGFRMLLGG